MVVNTNIQSINAHRNMKNQDIQQIKSSMRLASGLRVNSAADDAAGLAIVEKMRSQVRGLDRAVMNAEDGRNYFMTGDGGLNEINNSIIRMRELSIQAANDTNTDEDRQKIQEEIRQLIDNIDAIVDITEYNTKKILKAEKESVQRTVSVPTPVGNAYVTGGDVMNFFNGIVSGYAFQPYWVNTQQWFIGGDDYNFLVDRFLDAASPNGDFTAWRTGWLAAGGATGANLSVAQRNQFRQELAGIVQRALQAGFDSAGLPPTITIGAQITPTGELAIFTNTQQRITGGTCSGDNRHYGHQFFHEGQGGPFSSGQTATITMTRNATITANEYSDKVLWLQLAANAVQGGNFTYKGICADQIEANVDGRQVKLLDIDVGTVSGATEAIQVLDYALNYSNTIRALFGAFMNRLEFTANSNQVTSLNLAASESRIRDADMAKETMDLTKANASQQAATSMLAQANQQPERVVGLLRP